MPTVESSWKAIRTQLVAARLRAGLDRTAIHRRLRIHRATIGNLEGTQRDGAVYSRIDTAIGYAHVVGLDLIAAHPHQAHLLALNRDDTVAVLRALQAAADGHRLNPLQARKISEILTRILPPGDTP